MGHWTLSQRRRGRILVAFVVVLLVAQLNIFTFSLALPACFCTDRVNNEPLPSAAIPVDDPDVILTAFTEEMHKRNFNPSGTHEALVLLEFRLHTRGSMVIPGNPWTTERTEVRGYRDIGPGKIKSMISGQSLR